MTTRAILTAFTLLLAACGSDTTPGNQVTSITILEQSVDMPHLIVTTGEKAYDVEFATCPVKVGYVITEVEDTDLHGMIHILANGEPLDYYLRNTYWTANGFTPDL